MNHISQSFAQDARRENRKEALAIDPALGSIYICSHCTNIHMDLHGVHFRTDLEGFQALTVLIQRAAANFELWAEAARGEA